MKRFFTRKRIIFAVILVAALITLIALLIAPIGSTGHGFWIYTPENEFVHCTGFPLKRYNVTSPFTLNTKPYTCILVEQTIVFTVVGIIFLVYLTLFMMELKKAGVFKLPPRRPSKVQQLEARIAELEKQAAECQDEK